MASWPYEELVVRWTGMNLWGLALVLTLAAHRQERNESAEPVTNKPSAIVIRGWQDSRIGL